jgi:hypothetical protein
VDQTRVPKKTNESNPEGRRKARMRRFMGLIWLEDAYNDLRMQNMTGWRQEANNMKNGHLL